MKHTHKKPSNKMTDNPIASTFKELNLSPNILKSIQKHGYTTPTPIQAKAIPIVLEKNDLLAAAQTGTGKTASFVLPILEGLQGKSPVPEKQARTLILTPTRELASQILDSITTYGEYLPIKTAVVFGGVNINPQKNKLKKGVDILVATPGRLLDLYSQKAISFNMLDTLVLDEADRMLDMGFIHDIRKIISKLPKDRQTLMFSATFSEDIRKLAKSIIKNPIEVSVTERNTAASTIVQGVYNVKKSQKAKFLSHLINQHSWNQVLVFTKTKHGANKLTTFLKKEGINTMAIHGNKSQSARTKALEDFKDNKVRILIATDIASRGLDIDQLPHVINYELPFVAEDYVHRIGRTGRAGSCGEAISLVCADEKKLLFSIERLIKQSIPIKTCDNFNFEKDVPTQKKEPFSSKQRPKNNTTNNQVYKKNNFKKRKNKYKEKI